VRGEVKGLKGKRGVLPKVQIMYSMLKIAPWNVLPLRIHFVDSSIFKQVSALPVTLPIHISTCITQGPIEEMWMYKEAAELLAAAKEAKAAAKRERQAISRGKRVGKRPSVQKQELSSARMDDDTEVDTQLSQLSGDNEESVDAPKRRKSVLHRIRVSNGFSGDVILLEDSDSASEREDEGLSQLKGRSGLEIEGEFSQQAPPPHSDIVVVEEEEEEEEEEERNPSGDFLFGSHDFSDSSGSDQDSSEEGGREKDEIGSTLSEATEREKLDASGIPPLEERLKRRAALALAQAPSSIVAKAHPHLPPQVCPSCRCKVNTQEMSGNWVCTPCCHVNYHAQCLSGSFLSAQFGNESDPLDTPLVPNASPIPCPTCSALISWPALVEGALRRGYKGPSVEALAIAAGVDLGAVERRKKKRRAGKSN